MSSSSSLEEFTSKIHIISRPPSVLYRYHKTPIHVSSDIKSAYDFPLGAYNVPTTVQQIYYIEDICKDNKKSKRGLFESLRRKKNDKKNINFSTSNRNSAVYGYEDIEIRRHSV